MRIRTDTGCVFVCGQMQVNELLMNLISDKLYKTWYNIYDKMTKTFCSDHIIQEDKMSFSFLSCNRNQYLNCAYMLHYDHPQMHLRVEVGRNFFDQRLHLLKGTVEFKITDDIQEPIANIEFPIVDERIGKKFYPNAKAVVNKRFPFLPPCPEKPCGIELIYSPSHIPGIPNCMAYERKYPELVRKTDPQRWTKPIQYFSLIDRFIRDNFPGYCMINEKSKNNPLVERYTSLCKNVCTELAAQAFRIEATDGNYQKCLGKDRMFPKEQYDAVLKSKTQTPAWVGDATEAVASRERFMDEWMEMKKYGASGYRKAVESGEIDDPYLTEEDILPDRERAMSSYKMAAAAQQALQKEFGNECILPDWDTSLVFPVNDRGTCPA